MILLNVDLYVGISSTDSGMDSPSDHSISLFDYLTLEHPPFGKPMDDLHLDYLYDRLSTYSVDMMIHKLDRVNKLGDDVLSIESKLLEVGLRLLSFYCLLSVRGFFAQESCVIFVYF